MKSSTYTEFGNLKEVIVGREIQFNKRLMDSTFKIFYKHNIENTQFNDFNDYSITSEIISERIEDLNNLANTLSNLGIKVHRPDIVSTPKKIVTPTFDGVLHSSASNVRDMTFTYANSIIETPPLIRGRYFENLGMYDIFMDYFKNGSDWIKAPNPKLLDTTVDFSPLQQKRDYNNIPKQYDMAIDAAQFTKIGKDILCNKSTFNHELGYMWMKRILEKEGATLHILDSMIDNHIDGSLVVLRPGTFLVNESCLLKPIKEYLPKKFKNWDMLTTGDIKIKPMNESEFYNIGYSKLASTRGMDVNVLSINDNTVIVNESAVSTIDILDKNGFNVIPIKLRHSELFGGGIHCHTLDMVRENEQKDYTK